MSLRALPQRFNCKGRPTLKNRQHHARSGTKVNYKGEKETVSWVPAVLSPFLDCECPTGLSHCLKHPAHLLTHHDDLCLQTVSLKKPFISYSAFIKRFAIEMRKVMNV